MNGMKRKQVFCTCKWLIGFILMALGSILHIVVLPFVDVVVLSTGTGISLVCNTVLAIWYLGESFNVKYDVPSFTLIIGGCATIVLLSQFDEIEYTPEDIKRLISSGGSIALYIMYFVAVICAILQYQWHKR